MFKNRTAITYINGQSDVLPDISIIFWMKFEISRQYFSISSYLNSLDIQFRNLKQLVLVEEQSDWFRCFIYLCNILFVLIMIRGKL